MERFCTFCKNAKVEIEMQNGIKYQILKCKIKKKTVKPQGTCKNFKENKF